jgi:hypothetical protein
MSTLRFRWVVYAFVAAGLLMAAMLGWQLYDLTPARWCVLATQGSPDLATGCVTMLVKLLDIKDHVMIGLLAIVGLSVLSLAAVALGVRLGFTGPGGLSANVGADKTTVTDGQATVTLPTPPAEETQA